VAGIGSTVWADVLAIAGELEGGLRDQDVVLDEQGQPRVSPPTGRRQGLDPQDPRVAPEVGAGAPVDQEAVLWGLGVILYRLATGQSPRLPLDGGPPPRASTLRADLPAPLDEALARLLDPTPGSRHTARPLLHQLAGPLPDLRRLVPHAPTRTSTPSANEPAPRRSRVGEVKVTTAGGDVAGGRTVQAPARGMLVLPAAVATPADVSAAAGSLGVPLSAVKELVDLGTDVPVHGGLRGAALSDTAASSPLPLQPSTLPGPALPVLAGAAALVGGGVVVLGLAMLVASVLAALAVAAVGGAILLAALVPVFLWIARFTAWRGTASTWKQLQRQRELNLTHPLVGGARSRLAALRQHLSQADHLPAAADADVRASLADLEQDLDALATRHDHLSDQDGDAARTLRDEVARVEEGLDAVSNLLQRVASPSDVGGALDRVVQTAELAARSVQALDAEEGDRERARRARQAEQQRS